MRTKITTATLLAGLLLGMTSGSFAQAPANTGASITINSTTYVVATKTSLATGVEYYTVKATPTSTPVNFLRTNSTYNPTVLTQAKYAGFLSTGKLSSFGTLSQQTTNGVTAYTTTVGSTTALFSISGNQLTIYEYQGTSTIGRRFDEALYCTNYSGATRTNCLRAACLASCTFSSTKEKCETDCKAAYATKMQYSGVHVLTAPRSISVQ